MTRKFLTGIDMGGQRVVNGADASGATDLTTLQQVQALARGLDWKNSVHAASTANVSLTSPGATMDGVTLVSGDRVLLKNQTTTSQNGIYTWTGSGATLTRTSDAVQGVLSSGAAVFVTAGTNNIETAWTLTTADPITVDTTALTFVQFGGGSAPYTAGAGLSLASQAFAVVAGNGILADGTSTRVDPSIVVRKYATTIGDGSTLVYTVTHGLATTDVHVAVQLISTKEFVDADVIANGTNTVTVGFAVAPASNTIRVIVHG